MGLDFSVAFKRDLWPSQNAIVAKASEFGYSLSIPDLMELAPPVISGLTDSCDVVGKFEGQSASFVFEFAPASEHHEIAEVLDTTVEEMFGDRDTVLTMRESINAGGIQMALVVAATLVSLADGVFFDDFDNVDTTPDRILEEVRSFDESDSEQE